MSTAVTDPAISRAAIAAFPPRSRAAYRPLLASAPMALCDLLALNLALAAGYGCWFLVNPAIPPFHPSLLLVPVFTIGEFVYSGHYPGYGLTAPEHIRRICRGISLVYLLLAASLLDRKSTRLNSSHLGISYAVFCLK